MDTDYDGHLFVNNVIDYGKIRQRMALIRNEKIGFVFQFHYLLNEYNVLKNVMLPGLKLAKFSEKEGITQWSI